MKRTIIAIMVGVAASLFAATSCQRDEYPATQSNEKIHISIQGSIDDLIPADGVKASAELVVRVTWGAEDSVYVYDTKGKLGTLKVIPGENGKYAHLEGDIETPRCSTVTLVYTNMGEPEADPIPIKGFHVWIDIKNQDKKDFPFVVYATIPATQQYESVQFKFATAVMMVNGTGLGNGAGITEATVSNVNTESFFTINDGEPGIESKEPGIITRSKGISESGDGRATFTVGMVATAAAQQDAPRMVSVTKNNGNVYKTNFASGEIKASCSYTSVYAFVEEEWVEIGGVKWATKNLGATTVAGSNTTCYGDYFAWGETAPYYEGTGGWPATPTWKSGKDDGYCWQSYCGSQSFSEWGTQPYDDTNILKPEFDAAAQTLGDGWRMPTSQEFKDLADACGGSSNYDKDTYKSPATCGEATTFNKGIYWCASYDGVAGCLFCDGTNKLFFPAAGVGYNTSHNDAGSTGGYWSSSLSTSGTNFAFNLYFHSNDVNPQSSNNRYTGRSVRPVSD